MATESLTDTALIIGATMRLTRLVVTDDIGQWWIKDPLDRLYHPIPFSEALGDDPANVAQGWSHSPRIPDRLAHTHKYLSGLECPWCIGFWLGAGVLASHAIAKRTGLLGAWRFAAGAFTLNEVAAHAGVKIGDFG